MESFAATCTHDVVASLCAGECLQYVMSLSCDFELQYPLVAVFHTGAVLVEASRRATLVHRNVVA